MSFIPVQWGPSWTSLNICTCPCDRAYARAGGLCPYKWWEPGPQGGRLLYSEIEYNVGNGHMGTLICEQNDRHDWKHNLPWRTVINATAVKKSKANPPWQSSTQIGFKSNYWLHCHFCIFNFWFLMEKSKSQNLHGPMGRNILHQTLIFQQIFSRNFWD